MQNRKATFLLLNVCYSLFYYTCDYFISARSSRIPFASPPQLPPPHQVDTELPGLWPLRLTFSTCVKICLVAEFKERHVLRAWCPSDSCCAKLILCNNRVASRDPRARDEVMPCLRRPSDCRKLFEKTVTMYIRLLYTEW